MAAEGEAREGDFTDLDNYELSPTPIGTGAYGTVYHARERTTGQEVALKEIRVVVAEEGIPLNMIREIAALKKVDDLNHPNIVRLFDVCHGKACANERRVFLVFEYIRQDLDMYLKGCPSTGVPPERIRDLTEDLLRGVDFLHTHRIVHRDLKPQNLLVTTAGRLKIADFGLARVYSCSMVLTSVVVTLWYRSPEVLLQQSYASAVDMWSCGCIFAEMHNRRPLFEGQSDIDQLCKIFKVMGLPPEADWPSDVSVPYSSFLSVNRKPLSSHVPGISADGERLLSRLLEFNPNKRSSARDALREPYIKRPPGGALSPRAPESPTTRRESVAAATDAASASDGEMNVSGASASDAGGTLSSDDPNTSTESQSASR